ncbi:MAG: DUF2293 domain-containing protein [Aureliella sp.]
MRYSPFAMASFEKIDVAPGPDDRTVIKADGTVSAVPEDWSLLPPGDAGLTRRVKATGPSWTVKKKKGRRTFSQGVWAPTSTIQAAQQSVATDRADPAYEKRKAADAQRRKAKQANYVDEFYDAVLAFLNFDRKYLQLSRKLARLVTTHATPVGSGTVARTERIPIQRRAESAVIAWMRHQTTAYDDMKIPRVKGKRREIRRMLAEQSRNVMVPYRNGSPVDLANCPLWRAVAGAQV